MDLHLIKMREGWDGKKCWVHARMCETPDRMVATAQHLDVSGCDLFAGIHVSFSYDGGKTWSEFAPQEGLQPLVDEAGDVSVGCDGTPMYHKKTGKVLLLGHTAVYLGNTGKLKPNRKRSTFYSVLNGDTFSKIRFVEMPEALFDSGNGCGQSIELEDGTLLIPIYFRNEEGRYSAAVMHCAFDGETVSFIAAGNAVTLPEGRGLYEPSVIYHGGRYHMTIRADSAGYYTSSADGLHYGEPQLWQWEDGEILPNYNTQQHWLTFEDRLYLVYTRRGVHNDHVFRHRAPLLMAEARDGRLIRDTERILTPERGARLGNFCACQLSGGRAAVMAAEWMQPAGCEKYGSNNAVWIVEIK